MKRKRLLFFFRKKEKIMCALVEQKSQELLIYLFNCVCQMRQFAVRTMTDNNNNKTNESEGIVDFDF